MIGIDAHEAALAIVGAIVREWDPYGLLARGAPRDEFDSEIGRIAAQIHRISSALEASEVIARVFGAAFDADAFTPTSCTVPGQKLFLGLSEAGLLTGV